MDEYALLLFLVDLNLTEVELDEILFVNFFFGLRRGNAMMHLLADSLDVEHEWLNFAFD